LIYYYGVLKKMFGEERRKSILETIEDKGVVSVSELSERLNVSEVTIRRDLIEIEKTEPIRKTHGGAILCNYTGKGRIYEPGYIELENSNTEAKQQIAEAAFKLVQDNSAIIIDSSSTTKYLCNLFRKNPPNNLMVVTNSLRAAMILAECPTVNIMLTGGQIEKNLVSCIGTLTETALKGIRVDRAFIGVRGIDFKENSLTTPAIMESSVKTQFIACSKETIVLADHTKMGKMFLSKVCSATDVQMIITDPEVSPEAIAQANECGANLVVSDVLENQ